MALVARSGLDLGRFGMRYSHAGLSLKASDNTPWSVRQLYYACDERKPRVFDQGMPAFLLGLDDPSGGYISVVLLPGRRAAPWSTRRWTSAGPCSCWAPPTAPTRTPSASRYQNCNQWVAELLATAWGGLDGAAADRRPARQAQRWLKERGYEPSTFDVGGRRW